LVYFFKQADTVSDSQIARRFQMELSMAGYHTDILLKKRFIDQLLVEYEPGSAGYAITGEGRKYVVENSLIT